MKVIPQDHYQIARRKLHAQLLKLRDGDNYYMIKKINKAIHRHVFESDYAILTIED